MSILQENETSNVGIVIFDQVEVLDFCGPFEVFSVTSTMGLLLPRQVCQQALI